MKLSDFVTTQDAGDVDFRFKRRNPKFTILFTVLGLILGLVLGLGYDNTVLYVILGLVFGFALGTGVDYRQALHYAQLEKFKRDQAEKEDK